MAVFGEFPTRGSTKVSKFTLSDALGPHATGEPEISCAHSGLRSASRRWCASCAVFPLSACTTEKDRTGGEETQQHRFKGFSLTGSEVFLLQLCRQQSAESENDPETRDSEALIKRATGTALHRETT